MTFAICRPADASALDSPRRQSNMDCSSNHFKRSMLRQQTTSRHGYSLTLDEVRPVPLGQLARRESDIFLTPPRPPLHACTLEHTSIAIVCIHYARFQISALITSSTRRLTAPRLTHRCIQEYLEYIIRARTTTSPSPSPWFHDTTIKNRYLPLSTGRHTVALGFTLPGGER